MAVITMTAAATLKGTKFLKSKKILSSSTQLLSNKVVNPIKGKLVSTKGWISNKLLNPIKGKLAGKKDDIKKNWFKGLLKGAHKVVGKILENRSSKKRWEDLEGWIGEVVTELEKINATLNNIANGLGVPSFEPPKTEMPELWTPNFWTPSFEVPSVEMPSLKPPSFEIPNLEIFFGEAFTSIKTKIDELITKIKEAFSVEGVNKFFGYISESLANLKYEVGKFKVFLKEGFEPIKTKTDEFINKIKEAFSAEGVSKFFGRVLEGLANLKSEIKDFKVFFGETLVGIQTKIAQFVEQVKGLFSSEGINKFFEQITEGLAKLKYKIENFKTFLKEGFAPIKTYLDAVSTKFLSIAESIQALVESFIKLGEIVKTSLEVLKYLLHTSYDIIAYFALKLKEAMLNLSKFLSEVFIAATNAIMVLFINLGNNITQFFENTLNNIIDAINQFIIQVEGLIARLPFAGNFVGIGMLQNISISPGVSFERNINNNKSTTNNNESHFSNVSNNYNYRGYAFGYSNTTTSNQTNVLGKNYFGNTAPTSISTPSGASTFNNNVQTVPLNASSTHVNIEDEYLRYFRDIAEKEAINYVTTNTIVPQLTVNIESVKETADIDEVCDKLSKMLEEELFMYPEGAYI